MATFTRQLGDHPDLTVITVVGAPTLDELTEFSLEYNRSQPTRLTLWDWREGRLPEMSSQVASERVEVVAEQFDDLPDRRTASVVGSERDFGLARILGAWVQSQAAERGWNAIGETFRDYQDALRWLTANG